LGKEMRGEVVLRVGKDRPGCVRVHCGPFRKSDRTQEAARIIIDSTVDPPTVTIGAPGIRSDENSCGPAVFRPTSLMQRASEVIEQHPAELTKTKVAEEGGGNKQAMLTGIDILRSEGYVETAKGRSGYDVYTSVKPYRETDDEQSDRYANSGNALRTD
jgi:hypothetical protein